MKISKIKFDKLMETFFFMGIIFPVVRNINLYTIHLGAIDPVLTYGLYFSIFIIICIRIVSEYNKKLKQYTNLDVILLSFLIIYLISILLNINLGFMKNLKDLFWVFISFGYFKYANLKDKTNKSLLTFWIYIVSLFAFLSLLTLLLGWGMNIDMANRVRPIRFGFVDGRLFGLFTDPNFASISAIISLIASYIIYPQKGVKTKVMLLFIMLLNTIYVGLSGSRTGLIILLVTSFLLSMRFLIKNENYNLSSDNFIRFSILSLLVSCVIYGGIFLSNNYFVSKFESVQLFSMEEEFDIDYKLASSEVFYIHSASASTNSPVKSIVLERPDLDQREPRSQIWPAGIELWKSRPVFGVTHSGMQKFARINFPQNYLSTHNFYIHNLPLDILISSGLMGLLVSLLLFKSVVESVIIHSRKILESDMLWTYFVISVVVLLSALTLPEILFVLRSNTLFFWFSIGSVVRCSERVGSND